MGNTLDSQQINDQRYGQVQKFTYENSLVIQKVMDFQHAPDQLAACIHRCQFSQQLNHKNIIKLHKYEVNQLSVNIYFEHYDYDLMQDIQIRKNTNTYYLEHELLSILEQLISGLAYLQQQQLYHDDIRPQNIFMTSNQTFKLNQHWIMQEQSPNKYYAPEQQQNPYKSSAYSLGITMLHLMTLTSMDIIYLRNQVNQQLVTELLKCTNYSQKLVQKVQQFLHPHQQQRADFISQQQAKLQQKLVQSPPKTITSSQRYVYRTTPSPIIKRHSLSPFTFRRAAPQLVSQQPQIVIQCPTTPTSPILSKSFTPKQSIQESQRETPKTDLDYRIQKALRQTNETLKKNYMLQ